MKRLFFFLAVLLGCMAGALAQGPNDLNLGSQLNMSGSTGAYTFSWWGNSGCTYLVETSDDLVNWSYLPVVESGTGGAISWGLVTSATSLFVKLEYITVPPGQLTGPAFNGPDNDGDGLPDDWELFYFGHTGVNPGDYVPWSGGTITNLQAYQQGLNPTDFYNGTLPSLVAITGTSLPYESGSTAILSVQVTDALGHPIPGAPVIYSIDYGLLVFPDGSGGSQEVEIAADSNGYANVTMVEPLWQAIPYTVTAKAETGGLATSLQFTGETESDDPDAPPLPSPALPNPNLISEPALSVELSSTSVANPAFEEFNPPADPTPDSVTWYLVETATGQMSGSNDVTLAPETVTYAGNYLSVATVHPLFSGATYSGNAQFSSSGPDGGYQNLLTEGTDAVWSGTGTSEILVGGTTIQTYPVTDPYWGYGDSVVSGTAASGSQTSFQTTWPLYTTNAAPYPSAGSASESLTLSTPYTTFVSDVLSLLPAPSTWYASQVGNTIAWHELADDSSSFSVGIGTYKFACATTGSNPYIWEWYEVFQPDDDTQPIQATHKEWDNANQQSESPEFSIDQSNAQMTGTTNGTWYIARLDTQTFSQYPSCQWRHVVGIGELVNMSLTGLPVTIGTAATWSITPSTSGSLRSTSPAVPFNSFRAGRIPETVTITVTLPGGATMSTTLTIIAPTGVTYTKITPYSIPWWAMGAGMWGQYTWLPTTVSFYGCEFQEEKCQGTNPSGFFKQTNLLFWHNPNTIPSSSIGEPPDSNPQWITIQQDNTGGQLDLASATANLYAVAVYDDTCDVDEYGSGFEWQVPLRYRLVSDTDTGLALPTPETQSMQISSVFGSFVLKGDASDYQ